MGTCIPCSWIKSLNIVKMTMYPKGINRFNAILTKLPEGFSVDIDKLILSCIQIFRRPRITKIILTRRKKLSVLCHPTYYIVIVIMINRYKTTETTQIHSTDFLQMCQGNSIGKWLFSANEAELLVIHMEQNWTCTLISYLM